MDITVIEARGMEAITATADTAESKMCSK